MSVDYPDTGHQRPSPEVVATNQQSGVTSVQKVRRERFISNKSFSLDPDWMKTSANMSKVDINTNSSVNIYLMQNLTDVVHFKN